MMNTSDFVFDVVIAHLNYAGLRKSLESLRRNTPPENIGKVILVDQNPEYQEVDDLIDIHVSAKQLGFSKAMNTGIRLSDAPYVMCTNDDVEFLNPHWVEGIVKTFNDIPNAVGVNPSSPRNPGSPGGDCVEEWPYHPDMPDEEYARLVTELGHGWVIDTICTWCTIFDRVKLDSVKGTLPGQAWFDEYFYPGGGEDYDLNRRAYMSSYRMIGTGHSFAWHQWYGSNRGKVNWSNQFEEKWGPGADLFGTNGSQVVPPNILR